MDVEHKPENAESPSINKTQQPPVTSFPTNGKVEAQKIHFASGSDDGKLIDLLEEFQMPYLFPVLQKCGITFRSLKYLSRDDLKDGIPLLGHRIEFRAKLFAWRKRMYPSDDETSLAISKVKEWVTKNENYFQSSQSDQSPEPLNYYSSDDDVPLPIKRRRTLRKRKLVCYNHTPKCRICN